jgi:hypothetical protein
LAGSDSTVGAPSPGCPVPLKDWDPSWYAETGQVMKYHLRQRIATEFIDKYELLSFPYANSDLYFVSFNRNAAVFCAAYPDYVRGITPLSKAILLEHQQTGKAKVRARRT